MERLFLTGVPVTGKDMVNRDKELKELKTLIEMGQSVVIVSPRRYGKTSLILETLNRLKDRVFTVYIDLFRITDKIQFAEAIINGVFSNKKLPDLVKKIKESWIELLKKVEFKVVLENFEATLKLLTGGDNEELLNHALELPEEFSKRYGKPIIVAFDEFGDVTRLNGDKLLKRMRSYFQLHKNAIYIFSGSQETLMNNIFTEKKAAFYKFARIMTLTPIDKSAFKNYISSKFHSVGITIMQDSLDFLLEKTGCHPYYTLKVCQTLYLVTKGERKVIDLKTAEESFYLSFLSERAYLDEIWEKIKSKKYLSEVIRAVSQDVSPYEALKGKVERQYIYNALTTMEDMGLIHKVTRGNFRLIDPFLKEYLKKI
jgi:AAA+ ATPase superfamily predicted ATPase